MNVLRVVRNFVQTVKNSAPRSEVSRLNGCGHMNDFGTLYRAAYAERDPDRKQILLGQVQKAISQSEQDEHATMVKLGAQSAEPSKAAVAA